MIYSKISMQDSSIEYLKILNTLPWESSFYQLRSDPPSTKYFNQLKIVSSLFLIIVSPFAYQYGKTRAAVTVLTFAIAVGTGGLYSLQKSWTKARLIKFEILKIKAIAESVENIWKNVASALVNELNDKKFDSEQSLKSTCNSKLNLQFKQVIGSKSEYMIDDLVDIAKFLVQEKESRLKEVREKLSDFDDLDRLEAFGELLNACQKVAYGYLFPDKPYPDCPYVSLELNEDQKSIVKPHPDNPNDKLKSFS